MPLTRPKKVPTGNLDGIIPVGNIPDNTILKSETFRPAYSAQVTVSANADVEWWSKAFTTTRANSRILITYHSGQLECADTTSQFNARINWSVDSTTSGTGIQLARDHNHEWYNTTAANTNKRFFVSGQVITDQLTAGSHTIRAFAGAYNNAITFFYQGSTAARLPTITFQEIAQS